MRPNGPFARLRGSRPPLKWDSPDRAPSAASTEQIWIGNDPHGHGFEVAVASWAGSGSPTQEALRSLHAARLRSRDVPLCVALHDLSEQTWILGPNSTSAAMGPLPVDHAIRILQAALDEPSGASARARMLQSRDSIETADIPGFNPRGLFAIHELTYGAPRRSDWSARTMTSRNIMDRSLRGSDLVRALGFETHTIAGNALLLTTGSEPPRAIAILLRDDETFDSESSRFGQSPIYHGLDIGRQRNVPWLIMARGPQMRLYPTAPDVGVARRGVTQTYFGLDLALLDEQHAGYLDLAFSSRALSPGGSVDELLRGSRDYAVSLGSRLRDRIYGRVVDPLATAVAKSLARSSPLDEGRLSLAYRITLRILFRLLFQAYAEDTHLLPLHRNNRYTAESLKTLAHDFADYPDRPHDARSSSLWDGLQQVWRVIDKGDAAWGVPAYNGGLFGSDPKLNREGALLEGLDLTNDIIGPALGALLVDESSDGLRGPVDFRSLDVRDFGTIYEGLLEAGLSLAAEDLTEDSNGSWRPQRGDEPVHAPKGSPYFHTKSGDRKATGSYFTPDFVVEHLLERALDPTIGSHLEKVADLVTKGDQVGAARKFFDFRVADLAMGSGHFLVAAIGHIETKFGAFLESRPIPGVERELIELREAALQAMSEAGVEAEIDRSALLGRQIARRCIYGLDVNDIAVELARLAIWVRTFVPGLPMSSLDHQLVWANSLTGIGTVDEAIDALDPETRRGELTFSGQAIRQGLDEANRMLEDAAALKESTAEEARAAQEIAARALRAAEPARLLFDAAIAVRLDILRPPVDFDSVAIAASAGEARIQRELVDLHPAHFPVRFPEVFLREPSGFDVLLGNPPWEKAKVEEHQWWSLRFPGLHSVPATIRAAILKEIRAERLDLEAEYQAEIIEKDKQRRLLVAGPYPGIGSGDPDLYQAFAWRNWQLVRDGGRLGLVLPRGALSGSAQAEWRRTILATGAFEDVVFGTNSARWMFDQVHPQYTVGFASISKATPGVVRFAGPFHSRAEFELGRDSPTVVSPAEFLTWTSTAAFPLFPTPQSAEIFARMHRHPRFDSSDGFEYRAVTELHASGDRPVFGSIPAGDSPMPILAGASFNLWDPDFGEPFAVGGRDKVERHLDEKIKRGTTQRRSAYFGMRYRGAGDLPTRHPRIAFRDIARPTDTRTAITCLVPPGCALVHNAPTLVRRAGNESDDAYLLGLMSSIPFDWQVRRTVELHMTYELLNPMAVPRPDLDSPLRLQLVNNSARLAAVDDRYRPWADAVGVAVADLGDQISRADAIAENDALVAHLFGLSREQLVHIFETFQRGWDATKPGYLARLTAVLKQFDAWSDRVKP
jgi:hypothetical protein